MTLAALAAAIERGELSPREAVEDALDRIERRDAAYNSFITVRAEEALAEADALPAKTGALHGVHPQRILAQARKDLTQVVRDRLALALALVLPVALTALLGTTISLTVTDIPVVIQDLDQTPLSRQYADAFRNSLT